jgi:hypothetical protein
MEDFVCVCVGQWTQGLVPAKHPSPDQVAYYLAVSLGVLVFFIRKMLIVISVSQGYYENSIKYFCKAQGSLQTIKGSSFIVPSL